MASRESQFKLGDDGEDDEAELEKPTRHHRSSTPLTVVIRHSDESSRDSFDAGLDEETLVEGDYGDELEESKQSTAEKAGVILVCLFI